MKLIPPPGNSILQTRSRGACWSRDITTHIGLKTNVFNPSRYKGYSFQYHNVIHASFHTTISRPLGVRMSGFSHFCIFPDPMSIPPTPCLYLWTATMCGLSHLLPPTMPSQRIPTWNTWKNNVPDRAVREKFHFGITHTVKERSLYGWGNKQCQWRLRDNAIAVDKKVTVLNAVHTCIAPFACAQPTMTTSRTKVTCATKSHHACFLQAIQDSNPNTYIHWAMSNSLYLLANIFRRLYKILISILTYSVKRPTVSSGRPIVNT